LLKHFKLKNRENKKMKKVLISDFAGKKVLISDFSGKKVLISDFAGKGIIIDE
jgi:hypothetical protein